MFTFFIEHSKAVLEALGTRRIETVQGDVLDVADEVTDEFERGLTRPRQCGMPRDPADSVTLKQTAAADGACG
jgi:hypothetical protein